MTDQKRFLRRIFQHVLAECSIPRAFPRQIITDSGVLHIGPDRFALDDFDQIITISIGKAAHKMAEAVAPQLGSKAHGIVAGAGLPATTLADFEYFSGGHPLPDAGSLRAGEGISNLLRNLSSRSLVIFLISGGGSSLAEKPIPGISLDDLVAIYGALIHCGAPIAQINSIRKHLSCLKGGRLALAAGPARQVSAFVVDVPEDKLDALASGPTMPDSTTIGDCYAVAEQHGLLPQFPAGVRRLFERRELAETPKPGDTAFVNSHWSVLLSNADAEKAATELAGRESWTVVVDNGCDDWDYVAAADYLLDKLRKLRQTTSRACLISGGEVTVRVDSAAEPPGIGGRNQQFALYVASRIVGENVAVLSAGTDGIDGNSPAAGAVADGDTLQRAQTQGIEAAHALQKFNAFPFFEDLGDTVVTGPTGNNIRDLRVLLAW